ncbi:TPA: coenzyme F430 synthase [Methanosarcina acetivorans]|uniref:Coenzyme F(430) synthetase n=2 Tax=Methanosarcina acetivorans TaxID=2214 RepID=CFBE_METAC|nr:coenzyme F430 synthase [Methanosarcina acetivorans]Q8TJZ6.1 RecName: Full=Coenzyme F(430) synthetase [Methanosarcina acetivorans C2A]AAM06985.1 UDP-N-acetylmuramoylalanine-D-glutamate ligase [Methanosarcina acetivorans C2A]HIH93436.1 coenzyme F430 synthase [Methanosarcina acetivorans]
MDLFRKKLAVLDLTHGGIPIARKLAALGNDVSGVDVYGTVDQALLGELEEKYGIRCSKAPLPVSDFDLLIAPVHLDPAYPMLIKARSEGKTVLSHHEAVGKILQADPRLSEIKIVEITGVKAKTSTASLLADMLSRSFKVVLHTSRGLEAWKAGIPFLIHRGLSITPGSILIAVEKSLEQEIRPEFFIFEISIGATGTADLGILTTLSPDYGIANNTSLASDAKLQLVLNARPGSTLLLNAGAEKALEAAKGSLAKVLTFKDPFCSDSYLKLADAPDFVLETESGAEKNLTLHFLRRGEELFSASLCPGYNSSAYRTAFVAASAAALELGVGLEAIVSVLEEFRGLSGRMQEKELNGVVLVDNSNSGMDILSAEKALEYALLKKKDEKKGNIILILGEEASQVCEGLPPGSVQGFLEKFGTKCRHIILVGERMEAVAAENASYAGSLPEGLQKASELAGTEDIILSSVKCFR